jgi:hypothetical protein
MGLMDALRLIADLGGVLAFTGGLIVLIFQERLKARLSHVFAEKLEDKRASIQRELESYKVSLIAETEKVRAVSEVRKVVALKLAERKLSCLTEAYVHQYMFFPKFTTILKGRSLERGHLCGERISTLHEMLQPSVPFITNADAIMIYELLTTLDQLKDAYSMEPPPAWRKDDPLVKRAFDQSVAVGEMLKKNVDALTVL